MPDLDLPIPGVTPGPEWATKNNAALNALNDVMETGRLSQGGISDEIVTAAAELNPAALSDSFIAQQITTPGSQTATELSAAIGEVAAGVARGADTAATRTGRFSFDLGTTARRVAGFEPSRLYMILRAPADQGMQVALGFPDSTNDPGIGYELITAGQEVLIQDTRPVWAYLATSAGSVIINKKMGK